MQELNKWAKLVAEMKRTRVRMLEKGQVWKLAAPSLRHRGEAQHERLQLARALVNEWHYPALWSGSDDGSSFRWSFPDADRLEEVISSLYEGEWVLLFFSGDAQSRVRDVGTVPTQDKRFTEFVSKLGAAAAIVSWVDDDEWLVFISGSPQPA